jgi:hypothetical protein
LRSGPTEREDACGRLILDFPEGRPALEIVERNDGFINASSYGPEAYFAGSTSHRSRSRSRAAAARKMWGSSRSRRSARRTAASTQW